MIRMEGGSNYFDIFDSVDTVSTSSAVHPEYSVVSVSRLDGVGWIPLFSKCVLVRCCYFV